MNTKNITEIILPCIKEGKYVRVDDVQDLFDRTIWNDPERPGIRCMTQETRDLLHHIMALPGIKITSGGSRK